MCFTTGHVIHLFYEIVVQCHIVYVIVTNTETQELSTTVEQHH